MSFPQFFYYDVCCICSVPLTTSPPPAPQAMVLVAPKLSGAAVCAQLLKYLAKCQMDDVSAIRVNTNICLGKIAPHLEPGVNQFSCVDSITST